MFWIKWPKSRNSVGDCRRTFKRKRWKQAIWVESTEACPQKQWILSQTAAFAVFVRKCQKLETCDVKSIQMAHLCCFAATFSLFYPPSCFFHGKAGFGKTLVSLLLLLLQPLHPGQFGWFELDAAFKCFSSSCENALLNTSIRIVISADWSCRCSEFAPVLPQVGGEIRSLLNFYSTSF